MAAFTNQIANLSNLAIALTILRRQLKAPFIAFLAQNKGKRNKNDGMISNSCT
jgi:hypothetical protein